MKLKKLEISNFRCFESLSVDLDEQLTVLVARNGQGKSAVLDSIRIGLWSFVGGFDLARNPGDDSANSISIDDVRMLKISDRQMECQLPCKITLEGNFGLNVMGNENKKKTDKWTRFRESEAPRTHSKDDAISKEIKALASEAQNQVSPPESPEVALSTIGYYGRSKDDAVSKEIKALASKAQNQVRTPESPEVALPAIGYYGTGRLWSQKKLTGKKTTQDPGFYSRLFGYRDCLDPASSYKHFVHWFTWIFECYREQQFNEKEKGVHENVSVWKDIIQVVQDATNILLQETGWHSLEYSVSHGKALILKHDKHGTLKVESLSDGIRGVLAMVGDIAYRCIKLNPHLGLNAARESSGVVMIDEIDMHLHPEWQQTILGNLIKAFPKIQFIVTTHSPQVISTVPSHQIRILDGNQVYAAEAGTQGAESSRILKRIFGVDSRPQKDPNTILLNEYLDLVYADKWAEAKAKREQLDAIYQGNELALTEADLYIENRQWELELEKNQ